VNDFKGDKPRKGDRVRVTFDADFVNGDDSRHMVVDIADGMGPVHIGIPAWASVEVLERADDPSRDLPGTQRREEHDGGFVLYVKGADCGTAWVVASSSALTELGKRYTDEFVAEFPRAGALPGTPAAEAEKHAPRLSQTPGPRCNAIEGATGINCGLPRLHAADVDHEGTHEPVGDRDSVGYRLFVRWPWTEWDRDAAAVGADVPLPEWEQELVEQEAARQQRVFRSDGPEPPQDVKTLEWIHYGASYARYLARNGDGWSWVNAPGCAPAFDDAPLSWSPAAHGSFREVLS
jgi:hypothetical protein